MATNVDYTPTISELTAKHGNVVTRPQVEEYFRQAGRTDAWRFLELVTKSAKIARGQFDLSLLSTTAGNTQPMLQVVKTDDVGPASNVRSLIPPVDPLYVPCGNFADIKKIFESRKFYPTIVVGETGNGKTLGIIQAAAAAKREIYRVNVTVETDEDALMGGFRLVNGNTVYEEGPVPQAMRTGSVLLLDEFDLAHPAKTMCLQSVMEGNGYYIKRTNTWVMPAPGFNIIATANTRGTGDETGVYVATNILNEAYLDRFAACFNQDYPSEKQETKILDKQLEHYGLTSADDKQFTEILIKFAASVRKARAEGADLRHNITTRRLTHIMASYAMWNDRKKALNLGLSRFDEHHRLAFMDMYKMHDPLTPKEEKKLKDEDLVDQEISKIKPW